MKLQLQITDPVDTTIGIAIANTVSMLEIDNSKLLNGIVSATLKSYASASAEAANAQNIFLKKDGKYIGRIADIILTQNEIIAANLPLTIHNKVKDYLISTYSWTVTVNVI